MSKKFIWVIATLAVMTASFGCHRNEQWRVTGTIDGMGDTTMIVEVSSNGSWFPLDTIDVNKGSFSYSGKPQGYPDIYRLRLGNQSIYFPIDSIEQVKISSTKDNFAGGAVLSGSPEAERVTKAEKIIAAGGEEMKRQLAQMIVANPSSLSSYYIINKVYNGKPLFSPSDPKDLKIIGAVANWFATERPDDPRTEYLKNLFLSNRKSSAAGIAATEMRAPEINLYDAQGRQHSLLDETSRGKVVVLNFLTYGDETSPGLNIELNRLMSKYRSKGLDVFQVALDQNEGEWKAAVSNLPWTAVLLPPTNEGQEILARYNVQKLPTVYIFSRNGELATRVDSQASLEGAILKLL